MKRREFLKAACAGMATTAVAKPAVAQQMPEMKWRLTASWPKSLDTLYGNPEYMAKPKEARNERAYSAHKAKCDCGYLAHCFACDSGRPAFPPSTRCARMWSPRLFISQLFGKQLSESLSIRFHDSVESVRWRECYVHTLLRESCLDIRLL
jgi:hypothetical protein